MLFEVGFEKIKEDKSVGIKLPEWEGFWIWRNELSGDSDNKCKTIIICCKDGYAMDIRSTKDVDFTIKNMLRDDWEIVKLEPEFFIYPDYENCVWGEGVRYCWEM